MLDTCALVLAYERHEKALSKSAVRQAEEKEHRQRCEQASFERVLLCLSVRLHPSMPDKRHRDEEKSETELHPCIAGSLLKLHGHRAAANYQQQKLTSPQYKLPPGRMRGKAVHEEAEASLKSVVLLLVFPNAIEVCLDASPQEAGGGGPGSACPRIIAAA